MFTSVFDRCATCCGHEISNIPPDQTDEYRLFTSDTFDSFTLIRQLWPILVFSFFLNIKLNYKISDHFSLHSVHVFYYLSRKITFFMLGTWYCIRCFLSFFLGKNVFSHPLQVRVHNFSQVLSFMTFSTISSSKMFYHFFQTFSTFFTWSLNLLEKKNVFLHSLQLPVHHFSQ